MTGADMSDTVAEPTWMAHGRVRLALHQLKAGSGRALLVLHGLGESTSSTPQGWLESWSGPVWGLDFTGHGRSSIPVGGGYTSEVLMADADTALRRIGQATVLGRGLGAYVALLLAGAPSRCRGRHRARRRSGSGRWRPGTALADVDPTAAGTGRAT